MDDTNNLTEPVDEVLLLRKTSVKDVLAVFISCIGGLLMGMTLTYSSPALNDTDFYEYLINDENRHWFGSLIAIGAIIGGFLGGFFRSKLGLKSTMILCNVPCMVGWLVIILKNHIILTMFGRILTGVGVGIISMVVPIYVAEVSNKSRRGVLGFCFQLFISIGIFLSYSIGIFLEWYFLALFIMIVHLVYGCLVLLIPESPHWLLVNHRRNQALKELKWLHIHSDIAEEELNKIIIEIEDNSSNTVSLKDLKKPSAYKPTLVAIGLMILQQMSGVNGIFFYCSVIFINAGFKDNIALPTIVIAVVQVIVTLVSCLLVDRLGRKILFYISSIFMSLSMLSFGFFYYITEVTENGKSDLNWWSLLSVCSFIVSFCIGWSGLPWLVSAEIVPLEIKSISLSLSTVTNWLFAFLVTKEIDHFRSLVGDYGVMWIFSCFCALGVVFVRLFLPETKGKSLEEIRRHFQGPSSNDLTS